ncbi:MAG: TRAP transporter large permease subunit [Desulfobacteraceae bacterium]|jgi:tripartite ATP-independent transporter DctM subunit
MEWWLALIIILGGLMGLLITGMPVAFCFMVVNLIGAYFLWDGINGFYQLADSIFSSVSTFSLLPVPLFVIMGEVLFHSRLALKAIDVVDKWLGKIPGRLGVLALASGTMFSCLSGSSIGTTAMLGSIMIPDMEKRGYKPSISIGSCMCGALAMIIPPSALAVILAAIAGVSVGKVLIGGIIPGLLLAVLYIAYIVGRCIIQPSVAPSYTPEPVPFSEKIRVTVKYLLPLGAIVFSVVGLIFLGIATPSESAAMGALATFILAACYGRLNMDLIKKSLAGTLKITVMMFLIVTGSLAFSQILAYSGATSGFVQAVTDLPLPPFVLMIAMQVVILILGMFMEQVSIMLITLPIFMPMVSALGFNEIWFVLIMLVNLEVAMETPPFGFLLFVMKGVVPEHITMSVVYKSTLPFIIIDVTVIILMLLFPELVTWLPEHAF